MYFVTTRLNTISSSICTFDILKCVKCTHNSVNFYTLICKIYSEMLLNVNNSYLNVNSLHVYTLISKLYTLISNFYTFKCGKKLI